MNIMLLVFSILPVFLIGYYIYNKDKDALDLRKILDRLFKKFLMEYEL